MKTYFDKDTGAYLGNTDYAPDDPSNPWAGHPFVDAEFNAEWRLENGMVVPAPPPPPPPLTAEDLFDIGKGKALWGDADRPRQRS